MSYQSIREFKKNLPKVKLDPIEYCNILKISSRALYDRIGEVKCPILNENVVFNGRGFHHLLNNSDGTARDVNEIIHKLTFLPLAKSVIKNASRIEEERDVMIRESRKKNSKLKKAKTYCLVARVGNKKPVEVRVILLRIGDGILMFRSVMRN
ncbi:MAG: hypothetical protein NTU76_04050 [Candidatus Taylorbacteria bacterium]|nr:hypothetical protein [Candidatus Taylorbacteria bacterium]